MRIRNWSFQVGAAVISVNETDFQVIYEPGDKPNTLKVILRGAWEAGISTPQEQALEANGLARIQAIEERILDLVTYVERTGTLTIDPSLPGVKIWTAVKFSDWSVSEQTNDFIEYDMTFEVEAFGGDGVNFFRKITCNAVPGVNMQDTGTNFMIDGGNFAVQYTTNDRTFFKEIFRNAPVRIPAGPDLTTITVTAIKQLTPTPVTDNMWRRREGTENLLKQLLPQVGKQFVLIFDEDLPLLGDGVNEGTCHLQSVTPSSVELPDAAVYDMVFVKGYVT